MQRLPETLSQEEQQALLQELNPDAPIGLRNLVMVRLLLNAGLRANEICGAQLVNLDLREGKLKILGKGKKERFVWLGESDLKLLGTWLTEGRSQLNPENGLLFVNRFGRRLSTRYLRRMVKAMGDQAGIPKDLHPHTLRHTFATDLLSQTKNLRVVQKALGHARITTTEIYTHVVDDELAAAMQNLRG